MPRARPQGLEDTSEKRPEVDGVSLSNIHAVKLVGGNNTDDEFVDDIANAVEDIVGPGMMMEERFGYFLLVLGGSRKVWRQSWTQEAERCGKEMEKEVERRTECEAKSTAHLFSSGVLEYMHDVCSVS
jgi:hypothetical protein